jgi:hypothetical protein
MGMINLYAIQFDWLTLTSFGDKLHDFGSQIQTDLASRERGKGLKFKWQNYHGRLVTTDIGSLFVGIGEQAGQQHYALYFSGELADVMFGKCAAFAKQTLVRCTRMDLQATIHYPVDWSQWALISRLKRLKRPVEWRESRDDKVGALETVYYGSRTSDRFARIYVKVTADNSKLLRLEFEYKGDRSDQMFHQIRRGVFMGAQYWAHDYGKIKDKKLNNIFAPCLPSAEPVTERVQVKTDLDKTAAWLTDTCLPALSKYLNDPNHGADVPLAFVQLLSNYYQD